MRAAVFHLLAAFALFGQADEYNPIYRGDFGKILSQNPNAFLVDSCRSRKPGKALDVGMGQGRNSLFLAALGWQVTGIDLSDEGMHQARREAASRGLQLTAIVADFKYYDFGEQQWNLIVLTCEPTKLIAPKIERALRPGGAVVVEDRHVDTRRVWPAGTFRDNELPALFPNLRVLRYEDVWAPSDWSVKKLNERLVRLLAEKPAPRESGCIWEGKPVPEGTAVCWESVMLKCKSDGWGFTRPASDCVIP